MGNMEHIRWFKETTQNASGLEASQRSGVTTSTLNRQLSKGELSPENVIAIGRAYGQHAAHALAATGYLTTEEATGLRSEAAAELLSDRQLIRELARRVNADEDAWFGTFGELSEESPNATVTELAPHSNDTTPGVQAEPYAANRRKPEPEEGDDDFGSGA